MRIREETIMIKHMLENYYEMGSFKYEEKTFEVYLDKDLNGIFLVQVANVKKRAEQEDIDKLSQVKNPFKISNNHYFQFKDGKMELSIENREKSTTIKNR